MTDIDVAICYVINFTHQSEVAKDILRLFDVIKQLVSALFSTQLAFLL